MADKRQCETCEQMFVDNSRWYNARFVCKECFQVEYEDAMVARAEAEADGR